MILLRAENYFVEFKNKKSDYISVKDEKHILKELQKLVSKGAEIDTVYDSHGKMLIRFY